MSPYTNAWEHGFYDDIIGFFRNFYGAALKTNPALDFASEKVAQMFADLEVKDKLPELYQTVNPLDIKEIIPLV